MPGPGGYQGENLSQTGKLRPESLAVYGQDPSSQDWSPGQNDSRCYILSMKRLWRGHGVSQEVGVLGCLGASCRGDRENDNLGQDLWFS